jgi:hypothetical protein
VPSDHLSKSSNPIQLTSVYPIEFIVRANKKKANNPSHIHASIHPNHPLEQKFLFFHPYMSKLKTAKKK